MKQFTLKDRLKCFPDSFFNKPFYDIENCENEKFCTICGNIVSPINLESWTLGGLVNGFEERDICYQCTKFMNKNYGFGYRRSIMIEKIKHG